MDGYGLKTWKKYGISAELTNEDSVDEIKNHLERLVNGWHQPIEQGAEEPPLWAKTFTSSSGEVTDINESISPTQRIINQINEASSLKVLESFKLLAKNNIDVSAAYSKREKELQ